MLQVIKIDQGLYAVRSCGQLLVGTSTQTAELLKRKRVPIRDVVEMFTDFATEGHNYADFGIYMTKIFSDTRDVTDLVEAITAHFAQKRAA